MKKSLFAVAAVTAFAGAAQAQSSVTIYGIMDVGYQGKNTRAATGIKTQSSSIADSAESSSRLGFRGTEDLGGGTSAFFTIETGLTQSSSLYSTNNTRQAFVGLKKNGIGQFAAGTQYTPVFQSTSATDPGQGNNSIGSAIYPQGGVASTAQAGADAALTIRMNNALTVKSDKFAGATVGGMYSIKNSDSSMTSGTSGGTSNVTLWGINADYAWNKLYVTAAYQSYSSENDSGTASFSTVSTATVSGQTPAFTVTNGRDNQTYAGATYDFGILKAYLGYTNRKVTSNINSNEFLKRSAQQIGVRSYITPVIEAWASAGNGRYSAYGTGQPTANFTAYQLGTNYYLSKRTNLYGIFGSSQVSTASSSVQGSTGNMYALGVRHTF
jgi:predicted porin